LVSQPALQIKSHPLLTSAPGGTGGRQWPAGITAEQEEKIEEMTQKIGKLMADEGYRGFFGLDFLIEDDSGEIFVSENNARLTASVPFYTKQELALGAFPLLGYHLLSFLETPAEEEWQAPKVEGSEIVLRNTAGSLRQIRQTLPPGIYRFPLEFEEKAYFLPSGVKGKFWLTAAAEGRRLNPEIELARINVAEAVCNARGELKAAYLDLAEQVRKKLPLQAC
jgi:biotin carboxylase